MTEGAGVRGGERKKRSRARKLLLGLLLGVGAVVAMSAVAVAVDEEPPIVCQVLHCGEDPPPDDPPPYTPPANGFDWAMQERFGPRYDGIVDYHWNQATGPLRWGSEWDREKYDPAHVHPSAFRVSFNGCPNQAEYDLDQAPLGVTANEYRWTIAGQALEPRRKCSLTHDFPRQGPYTVSLTISGPNAAGPYNQEVVIKDHLIVSIGDSYASGEGNPDVNGNYKPNDGVTDTPARWQDRRCHRTANAGPAQAALSLERADPHSSVTFLSFACSGATINTNYFGDDNPDVGDPYKPGDADRPIGSGVLGTYRGVEPPNPNDYFNHVPAQIFQLANTVGNRRIDALVVSGGGNDMGFGPLAAACVWHGNCLTAEVTSATGGKTILPNRYEQDRSSLAAKYQALSDAINDPAPTSRPPLQVARTFITEYPDPTTDRDSSGNVRVCDEILEDILWGLRSKIEGAEVQWANGTVLPGLNNAVSAAATAHGWTYVGGMASGFQGHGYCVGNSDQPNSERWIRTAAESEITQGPWDRTKTTGTLHPTTRGHQVYRDRLLDHLPTHLAGLPIDGPDARNDSYSTDEDATLNVPTSGVLGNDTDPEGDPLTATKVSDPANGTVTLNSNGSFTYTPNANYSGSDSFTYRASDNRGSTSNVATVTITVNAVNDAPVANANAYSVNEDTTLSVAASGVLGNDSDPEGAALSATLVSGPTQAASFTLNSNGSFTYTPRANYSGSDSFTYRASGGGQSSNVATVTITVNAVNDAPVAANNAYSVNEDTVLTVAASSGVLANDTDVEGSTLTASKVSDPAQGTVSLNSNGSFTYTPAANYSGTVTFTYRANDGAANSNVATVTITVNPVNDAPVAVNNTYATNEDTVLTVAASGVLGNDTDVEGSTLTATKMSDPAHGTVSLNSNGSFTYTPNANYSGSDSFTYRASDGTANSNVATVTITVNAVNDAPVAANDAYDVNAGATLTRAAPGVLGNDTDVEGSALTASLVGSVSHGSLTLNSNGSFSYTPAAGYSGPDSFTYRASDGALTSSPATVAITVNPPTGTTDARGTFTPVNPARILDTRNGTGRPGGARTKVGPNQTITVDVTGPGGVPTTGVAAVVMNVTVTEPTAPSFLSVTPAGGSDTSSLNFTAGQTVPNLVTVPVHTDGSVRAYNPAGATHVLFDVVGWYADATPQTPGARHTAVNPARILDTRNGTGRPGGAVGKVGPNQTIVLDVTGPGAVPTTGVSAVTMNVTATEPTAASFVSVTPAGGNATSSLNVTAGQTVPNLVTVPVHSDGSVRIYNAAGSTHVLADVVAWYSAPGATGGAVFTPVTPARILDTRSGVGSPAAKVGANQTRTVDVTGPGGVPTSGVSAVVANVTVTEPTAPSFLSVTPNGGSATSNLNFTANQTVPNLVVVSVGGGGNVRAYNAAGATHVLFDVVGWFSG